MFTKVVVLCGLVAVCQAGLLPTPVHYSSAAAVSSQNIVRHDERARPVAIAAPVAYRTAPVAYHTPATVAYRAAPAAISYQAAPAAIAYHSAPAVARAEEYDSHPKYEYYYSVADGHTGDNKSQQESRDGDVVRGSYSLHEADGSIRTVEYHNHNHMPPMTTTIVALYGLVAVCQAGLLPATVQYSSAAAVSSQNIVRHDELARPAIAAYRAAPATISYQAAPARYSSAAVSSQNIVRHEQPTRQVAYQAAPAAITYQAAPSTISYQAAPTRYSSAAAVSSQNIVRHDQPARQVAYQAAPAAITYRPAPTPITYRTAPVVAHAEDFDAHPKYEYSYSVADGHTGDNKSQQETRDGDVVRGSCSLHEADGSIRTVEYSADAHNGFTTVLLEPRPHITSTEIDTP